MGCAKFGPIPRTKTISAANNQYETIGNHFDRVGEFQFEFQINIFLRTRRTVFERLDGIRLDTA